MLWVKPQSKLSEFRPQSICCPLISTNFTYATFAHTVYFGEHIGSYVGIVQKCISPKENGIVDGQELLREKREMNQTAWHVHLYMVV